jgi:hypothetical protein
MRHKTITATLQPDITNLRSTYGSFRVNAGTMEFAGDPGNCSMYARTEPSFTPHLGILFYNGVVQWEPSWNAIVKVDCLKYKDGTAIAAKIDRRNGTTVDKTFLATSQDTVTDTGDNDFHTITISGSSSDSGSIVTGQVTKSNPFLPKMHNYTYSINETWLDETGVLLNDYHKLPDPSTITPYIINWKSPNTWNAFTVAIENGHSFSLFNSNNWLSNGPAVTTDGGMKVVVDTSPPAHIYTADTGLGIYKYLWKGFAYRYVTIRVKADKAGAKLRFGFEGLMTSQAGNRDGWEIVITQADTWEDHEIDLLLPTCLVDFENSSFNTPISQSQFFHDLGNTQISQNLDGAIVHIYFYTKATYRFDTITGSIKSGGTRKPHLWFGPLDKVGDSADITQLQPYYLGVAPTVNLQETCGIFELVTNGMRCFNVGLTDYVPRSFGTINLWVDNKLKKRLGHGGFDQKVINDTGITFTNTNNPLNEFSTPMLKELHSNSGFWEQTAAGATKTFKGEVVYNVFQGYYGITGSKTTTFTSKPIYFDGEILGVTANAGKTMTGIEVNLHDNNTGALVTSAISDDDGLFRLFCKQGVTKPYSNTPRSNTVPSAHKLFDTFFNLTPFGYNFNSYWIKGDKIVATKDSNGYITNGSLKRDFIALNKWPMFYYFTARNSIKTLDTKKGASGKVYTAYSDNNDSIKVVIQTNMNSISTVVSTGFTGSSPRIEVENNSGISLLFYVNTSGVLKLYKTENDFGSFTFMADLASNTVQVFPHKDQVTNIIYTIWIDTSSNVWIAKVAPNGTKIPFSDNTTEKKISTITATSAGVVIKNGILCLKYVDTAGDLKQLFSNNTGDTWSSTF